MIFISYRTADAPDLVGRLDADLRREFGHEAVFRDQTGLEGGQDWMEVLEHNARTRPVMLVVIGHTWQTAAYSDGEWQGFLRLSNPEDWVRKEITLALDAAQTVIPVLLNGARMPSEGWLRNCGLERLHRQQWVELRSTEYEGALRDLLDVLIRRCPALQTTPMDMTRQSASSIAAANGNADSLHAMRRAYLQWLVTCHERLEFRGILHARGGAVSVALRQVYLALQADSTNALERAAARQSLLAELDEALESGDIREEDAAFAGWYLVAGNPLMPSLEARDHLVALDPSQKEVLNLAEAYYRESQLMVLGHPGSGKTTLARWLTLVSAQAGLDEQHELIVPLYQVDPTVEDRLQTVSLGRTRVPILVRIAEYDEARQRQIDKKEQPPTLLEFLGQQTWIGSVPRWSEESPRRGQRLDQTFLNQTLLKVLEDGEALVILDGLDEVPASALRDELVEEVDAFARDWIRRRHTVSQAVTSEYAPVLLLSNVTADAPGNRLIVTSRIVGYQLAPLRGDLAHVTVEPMSPHAVARFITNWMQAVHQEIAPPGATPDTVRASAHEEAAQFLTVLREPRQRGGRELATNPLLCGLLATVFRQHQGALPQERVALYQQAVEILFDIWLRRQRNDAHSQLLKYELYDILEPIAEHLHRHEPTGLIPENQLKQLALQFLAQSRGENPLRPTPELRYAVDEMIRVVQEDVGLIAARGQGVYGFLHLTFQEYLAARSLVKDLALACARLTEHLGDARWREAIRLALGYLNIENPAAFATLAREIVHQPTTFQDLLPQAALMIVGALPDLRQVTPEVVELLVEQLLHAYANHELLQRLPRRRDLFEGAFKQLLGTACQSAVDAYLANVLEKAAQHPDLAAAAACLLRRLEHYTPRLFQALQRGIEHDLPTWNWPIHAALRTAVTPRPGESEPRVFPPYGCLPFRQALLAEPQLVEHIRADFDWLRLVLVLYGGLGDYNAPIAIAEYHRMACFLQQEASARDRYRLAYVTQWGGDDGDFVLHIAEYLDNDGGARLKRAKMQPKFDPRFIHRDSAWTSDLLTTLRQEGSPRGLIPQFLQARAARTATRKSQEAAWLLSVLQDDTAVQVPPVPQSLGNERARINADLSDAVTRTGSALSSALTGLGGTLEPATWWALYEAAMTLALEHGAEPCSVALALRESVPSVLHPYLIAEALMLYGQGWGDDAAYNSAVFADTAKLRPSEFMMAHTVLPLAVNRRWEVRFYRWPFALLPPVHIDDDDISPGILTNIEMFPSSLGFMRGWSLRDVLKPLTQANPHLLPEILACALGDSGQRSSRTDIFTALAPELLTHPRPAQEVYRSIQAITDPYHLARGLLQLSQHWPEQQEHLIEEAAAAADQVTDFSHRQQIFEWLAAACNDEKTESYWDDAAKAAAKMTDPDDQARAWGRLALVSKPERAISCLQAAFQAAMTIPDEFARSTTFRLLHRVSAGFPELEDVFQVAIGTLQNPVQKARAAEDWRSVFRLLLPILQHETEYRDVWAVLSLASAVAPETAPGLREATLWRQLVEDPSAEHIVALDEASRGTLLELTPLAAQCLERILANGKTVLVESMYARLRAASWEVVPFLKRQMHASSPQIASLSSLFLVELQGLSSTVIRGLLECLTSSDDLLGNRAAEQLYGGPQEPLFRASLIGRETLDVLFEAGSGVSAPHRIAHSVTWFCARLLYDAESHIADWATSLRHEPQSPSAKRGLGSVHHVEGTAWNALLSTLTKGSTDVKRAVLRSMAHLAKHDRLGDGRWEELRHVMASNDHADLESDTCLAINLTHLVAVVLDSLSASPTPVVSSELMCQARRLLLDRHGVTWKSIFAHENSETGLAQLKSVGETMYSTKSEVDRWAHAANIAKAGVQQAGFLELLSEWTVCALTESIADHKDLHYERAYLLEVLAGAAMRAPARFHSSPVKPCLQPVLMRAVAEQNAYPGRADAMRLLGYMRHLSLELLPSLRSALADVEPMREAAIEAMGLFRRMDPEVLPELQTWLTDASGLVAFATARLLTAIGRHTQIAGRHDRAATALRRDIVQMLADAVRDPRSHRPLHFGANTTPTPTIPQLCDFFFDCMLKVAGYDEKV